MKFKLCLLGTFFYSLFSFGYIMQDSIVIKGSFLGNSKILKVGLYSYLQDLPIIQEDVSGNLFTLSVPNDIVPGVYYIKYTNEENLKTDIIIDGVEKNISYELKQGNFFYNPFPVFHQSNVNIKWYQYLRETQIRVDRLKYLFDFFANFSSQLDNKVLRYYQKERRQYYKLYSKFINNNSSNWAGLIVANNPHYFSNLNKKPVIRDFLRQDYFWEDIDTTNPKLINSFLYEQHINSYLSYINDLSKHHPFNESEKQIRYKKSSDIILDKFSKNSQTYMFAKKLLLIFFSKLNNKEVFDYVESKHKNF